MERNRGEPSVAFIGRLLLERGLERPPETPSAVETRGKALKNRMDAPLQGGLHSHAFAGVRGGDEGRVEYKSIPSWLSKCLRMGSLQKWCQAKTSVWGAGGREQGVGVITRQIKERAGGSSEKSAEYVGLSSWRASPNGLGWVEGTEDCRSNVVIMGRTKEKGKVVVSGEKKN